MHNLFCDLPDARAAEVTETLVPANTPGVPGPRVERITSLGQASPAGYWYDQDEDEWVAVLSGWGELQWADGTSVRLAAGDHVLIPAHTRHRVAATDPHGETVWLAVFWPATR
jgi:cupin 2 domain-containing protein